MEGQVLDRSTGFIESGLFAPTWAEPLRVAALALKRAKAGQEFIELPDGRRMPAIAGGAFTASGLFLANWIDILDATQLAVNLSLNTHKLALYTNSKTVNYSSDTAYSATNESTNASGSGYTAGGQVIVSPTLTESPTGTIMYDMDDEVWASPTSTTAHGAELYADALAGNDLIVGVTFGADFTSTAGTFTVSWSASGVFTLANP